jgi:hypothetical protein
LGRGSSLARSAGGVDDDDDDDDGLDDLVDFDFLDFDFFEGFGTMWVV